MRHLLHRDRIRGTGPICYLTHPVTPPNSCISGYFAALSPSTLRHSTQHCVSLYFQYPQLAPQSSHKTSRQRRWKSMPRSSGLTA